MLDLDLRKVLPREVHSQLVAFIPGLMFLICVAIGNPNLATSITARLQLATSFGRYTTLFAALFLAFVIGAVFINFVGVIKHVLLRASPPWHFFKRIYRRRLLLPILNRLTTVPPLQPNAPPPKPKPEWLLKLRLQTHIRVHPPSLAHSPDFLWWEALASQLLRTRYGMKDKDFPKTSWQPLCEVLTEPTSREIHGDPMMVLLHATGWSALAAAYFAPALHTAWFYAVVLSLIGSGMLHDLDVARILGDSEIGDLLRLRAVLREFPKLKSQHEPATLSEKNTDEE